MDCLDAQPSHFVEQLQQPRVNQRISHYTKELRVFSENLAVRRAGELDQ
jgi:hypothetical protein